MAAFGFDEGSGTTVGSAVGALSGTISGASWSTAGKFGNALSFNGTNSWVTVADDASLDLTTGMTLEAWVRPTTINGWETVILKESGTDLAYALYADNNGSPRRPVGSIRQGGTTYVASGSSQLTVNQWAHLAATYDGTVLKFFVNGTETGSLNRTGSIDTSNNPLRFGGNNIWSEWFNGLIDEVRVYNRALTLTEIQTDMNTPIGSDTTPPTVTGVSPASGATGVNASTTVAVTFSEGMDAATITNSTVLLRTPGGSNVSASVSVQRRHAHGNADAVGAAGEFHDLHGRRPGRHGIDGREGRWRATPLPPTSIRHSRPQMAARQRPMPAPTRHRTKGSSVSFTGTASNGTAHSPITGTSATAAPLTAR